MAIQVVGKLGLKGYHEFKACPSYIFFGTLCLKKIKNQTNKKETSKSSRLCCFPAWECEAGSCSVARVQVRTGRDGHTFNPALQISEYKASQGYIVKHSLNNNKSPKYLG